MRTNSIEINEELWGQGGEYSMPFQDIYFIGTHVNEGYIIPKEYSGKLLSEKARSFGRSVDGLLCFLSGDTMCVAEYELLKYRLKQSLDVIEQTFLEKRIESCLQCGQIDVPEYFGEYPPPGKTPLGSTETITRVCNGVYFVSAAGQKMFCICNPIWNSELSFYAQAFGRVERDYLFFDEVTCAIPVFELMQSHSEISDIVQSKNALLHVLWTHFSSYVLAYNEDEYTDIHKIPSPDPNCLSQDFLSVTE